MNQEWKFIQRSELEEILRTTPDDLVVVDVRDEDFEGGNIPGALNVPSTEFLDLLPELMNQIKASERKTIVFHCMKSQERGPYCCTRFCAEIKSTKPDLDLSIYVLKGGFEGWLVHFRSQNDSPELVENFDKECWW